MAAHQAPPSLGFSRQEYWSGLPFPPPMHESESEVAQSCPTLSDPMDCSPPGSSAHGILQARVLEWGAIAYDPAIPLLGIHTEETRIERDTCTAKFIAALFTIARIWKPPRCPSADKWIRKFCTYKQRNITQLLKRMHLSLF